MLGNFDADRSRPELGNPTKLAWLSHSGPASSPPEGSWLLVFASCGVRQRYFAGIAEICDVSFYASLNAALASLRACAMLLHVSRTGFGIHSPEHHRLGRPGGPFVC